MLTINLIIKRIIDIFGSIIGIILMLPIILFIAVAIKFDSKGPIIFKQDRLGKNGKIFKIWKFRTMVVNAENIGDGIKVRSDNDTRITRVGRLLRKSSLDELPQLFNVLSGKMSLVGPRPPLPFHPYNYNDYSELGKKRFIFKPGITGLTQVSVRNSVGWDERIKLDVQYVNRFSIILDIKILLLTLIKIFSKNNIYIGKDK